MGKLYQTIARLVAEGRYAVGQHASERLEERGIMEWQAVAGFEDGELLIERPKARPNPAIEMKERFSTAPNSRRCGRICQTVMLLSS